MKMDFKKMEDEMDLLVNKMSSVISFSDKISSTLEVNWFSDVMLGKSTFQGSGLISMCRMAS